MKYTLRLIFALLLFSAVSYAQNIVQGELDAFVTKTGAIPTIDKATNSLSFLRFPAGRALKIMGGTPQEKALNFVKQNPGLFTLQSDKDAFLVKESRKDQYGMEHVVLQQYALGVPVFDGVLKFHFNKSNDLNSLNGNFIKVSKLNPRPTISKEAAAAIALKKVESQKRLGAKKRLNDPLTAPLKVNMNTLYVFQKGLAQGYDGQKHLVYEVEVRNDANVREFLYIDAHSKEVVEQFAGMHEALNRELYTYPAGSTSTTIPTLTWKEGAAFPGDLDVWQQSEIESAGQIYHMMNNAFGHTSYNDKDSTMITTHNNPSISCPNANWNGVTANYCVGIATDDVVAHEWGHAYTEYTSGLIYQWQAGALNEAYSDIWGETVDQLNNYFDAGEGTALRNPAGTDCPAVATTTRWRMGEKATATGGAIRDMYNPNCFGDPGRVLDPLYFCTTPPATNLNDQGGVHRNSGVINHSYSLLVDGGTYNGQTINGIGLVKAAHIYWYAQENFMTKTTDFAAQADILIASAIAIRGNNLKRLSTGETDLGLSGEVITDADISELEKVLLAVELRAENTCNYIPLLKPVAEICAGGTAENALFFYNFENGLGDWTVSSTPGDAADWEEREWELISTAPNNRPGKVVYAEDYAGGNCADDLEHGVMKLTSPIMTIGAGESGPFNLAFDHYISLEPGWDGGNIKYKIGTGEWTLVPASAFTANGYNSTGLGNTLNPLAGQPAFTGSDGGSVAGSWGQSRINLSLLGVVAGDAIQLQWELGSDECNGWDGWYIDDVRVYSCATPSVQFVSSSTTVNEAEAVTAGPAPADCLPYVEKTIIVKINKAPSAPVTVTFETPSGTATYGETADYSFSPSSLVLQAGALSQNVVVRVYNDAYVEGPETAVLTYSLSGGDGFPETMLQEHTITIQDDEVVPGVVVIEALNANFNDFEMPAGWSSGNAYPDDWAVVAGTNPNTVFLDPNVPEGQPFLIANSDFYGNLYGPEERTWTIETAPFNTEGLKSLNLSFAEAFRVWAGAGDFNETGTVEVWDGAAWHNLLTHTEAGGTSGQFGAPTIQNIAIPEEYSNAAMKLRFRYTADWDYYWALDNIKVTGNYITQIESTLTATPDEQYLGPNATAYFYDPANGNLLAKIQNLTDWDYGCTSVSIDRVGEGLTDWVGDYSITNKTYMVTPTNPNPAGQYTITIYYTSAEIDDYMGLIQSMGKSEDGIEINNSAISSFAETQVSSIFNSDKAFTATFTSGFSGFGLSTAPPVGNLPVTLVKFEGKHTVEGNALKWETAAEVNNDYFAVERASNAKSFVEIARVTGNGTSAITNNYNFTDAKFGKGMNYYRLKQVDKDGTFAYSKMIAIDAANLRELKYFPNPVQALLSIELPDVDMKLVKMKIINASGQVVMEKDKVKTIKGAVSQDVSKLGAGLYQVVISDDVSSYNFSVVKL